VRLRYLDENNRNELVRWGKWLTSTLDLTVIVWTRRSTSTAVYNQWLNEVKDTRFAVSEAEFYDLNNLKQYVISTRRQNEPV